MSLKVMTDFFVIILGFTFPLPPNLLRIEKQHTAKKVRLEISFLNRINIFSMPATIF